MPHIDFIGEADYYNRLGRSKTNKALNTDNNIRIDDCNVDLNNLNFDVFSDCRIKDYLSEEAQAGGRPYDYSHLPKILKINFKDIGTFNIISAPDEMNDTLEGQFEKTNGLKLVSSTPYGKEYNLELVNETSLRWQLSGINELFCERSIIREVYDQGNLYWSEVGLQPCYIKSITFQAATSSRCSNVFNIEFEFGQSVYNTPTGYSPWETFDHSGLSNSGDPLPQDVSDEILANNNSISPPHTVQQTNNIIRDSSSFGNLDQFSTSVDFAWNFDPVPEDFTKQNFSLSFITLTNDIKDFRLEPFKFTSLFREEGFFGANSSSLASKGILGTPLPWISIRRRWYWDPVLDLAGWRAYYGNPILINGLAGAYNQIHWKGSSTIQPGNNSVFSTLELLPEELAANAIINHGDGILTVPDPLIVQGLTAEITGV